MLNIPRLLFRRSLLLCGLCFSGCFLLGFVLFFPVDPWVGRAEQLAQSQGVLLDIKAPRLAFPLVLRAEEVTVGSPRLPHPPIVLSAVAVAPLWSSLVGANPGVDYRLDVFGGEISGQAFRQGAVSAFFSKLEFDEPLGAQLPLRLRGELRTGTFDGILPLAGRNRSRLDFEMSALELSGLQKFGSENDSLPIGTLTCAAGATGANVKITRLEVAGPMFNADGSGTLRLGRTPATSFVNLTLSLAPNAAFDPVLLELLKLVGEKQAAGGYRFHLRGPLNAVQLVK